jgi:DNA-binding protein H-NS
VKEAEAAEKKVEEEEAEEKETEEAEAAEKIKKMIKEKEETFILPPSTAPAILSRAGRKRAPIIKALKAEKAPKRATGQGWVGRGRGRDRGRGRGRGRGS